MRFAIVLLFVIEMFLLFRPANEEKWEIANPLGRLKYRQLEWAAEYAEEHGYLSLKSRLLDILNNQFRYGETPKGVLFTRTDHVDLLKLRTIDENGKWYNRILGIREVLSIIDNIYSANQDCYLACDVFSNLRTVQKKIK